ncbi:MAG TPA: hypothetical protein VM658_03565, partial [bacterium]|nr:hypothetical protein [bacterium]
MSSNELILSILTEASAFVIRGIRGAFKNRRDLRERREIILFENSAVQNKRTGEPPRRQERQGLFFNTILRGLGCECFWLGAPVGRFAKPVGAN